MLVNAQCVRIRMAWGAQHGRTCTELLMGHDGENASSLPPPMWQDGDGQSEPRQLRERCVAAQ